MKTVSVENAVALIPDGATLMVGALESSLTKVW
jgi:hypothetical protein